METKPKSITKREIVFRVLAGILSVLFFTIGLPAAVIVAVRSDPSMWLVAFASLLGGLGFLTAAFTGCWLCFKRTHDEKNS
jgi:predicted permease